MAAFSFPSATVKSRSPKFEYPDRKPGWIVAQEREPRTPMPYGPPRSLVSLAVVSISSGRLFAGLTPALSYIFRLYAVELSSKPHGMHHCLASADPSAAPGTPFHAVDARNPGCTSSQSYFGLVLVGSLIHVL